MDVSHASEQSVGPAAEPPRTEAGRDGGDAGTVSHEAGTPAASEAPATRPEQAQRDDLPVRAEEAVAKLKGTKRERDPGQSPDEDNDHKRLKESHASPGPSQPDAEPRETQPAAQKSKSKSPSASEPAPQPGPQTEVPSASDSQPSSNPQREPEAVHGSEKARDGAEQAADSARKPETRKVEVDSSSVLQNVAGLERRSLGSVMYEPGKLLARGHELDFNCVLQVRVGHEYLRRDAAPVQRRELWGTQVYTDDSDLVAVLAHEGLLPEGQNKSDHDLNVEILLLPVLERYAGSYRHGLNSREWRTRHDGISYMVLGKPRVMPRGWSFSGVDQQIERIRLLAEAREWNPVDLAYADGP